MIYKGKEINIKSLIQKYILDFLSFVALVGAIIFFIANVFYNPLLQYNKTLEALSESYAKEELQLFQESNKVQKSEVVETPQLDAIPAFLTKVSNTCKNANVLITTLKQNGEDLSQFELQFTASYFKFLSVLGEFEKVNITINKIDIKPFELSQEGEDSNITRQDKSQHIVTLNISALNDGGRLGAKDLAFLDEELLKVQKRDPFQIQRFTKVGTTVTTNRVADLTSIYKLSGIGKIDGKYVATIEHKTYSNGDILDGMKIQSINSSSVSLEKNTPNGVVSYILNFRIKKEEKVSDEK